MAMGRGHYRAERVECMAWYSDYKYISQMLLLSIYQFSESMIVNAVIPVNASRQQGETKAASVLTRLRCSLGPRCSFNWLGHWNGGRNCWWKWKWWLYEWVRLVIVLGKENRSGSDIRRCYLRHAKKGLSIIFAW